MDANATTERGTERAGVARLSEPLRVGVVGAGAMGADHVRTLSSSVPAATVTRVYDLNDERALLAAQPAGAALASSAEALVASSDVDAVVIASPDATHADLILACLAAGKPVLCEKPLAVTPEAALEVVRAEVASGRCMIQVGFMRRYDPGFLELRRVIGDGQVGSIRLVHAVHRNASSSTSLDDATLVSGSMVHEIDTIPWLLDDELAGIRVESPLVEGFRDPQIATMWTRGGVMATVEVFVNATYGYDVTCEVVGTGGTATLSPGSSVSTRTTGRQEHIIRSDFVDFFRDAYRAELSDWVHAVSTGTVMGPNAWDGYVAAVAARAGIRSLASGLREPIEPGERPDLYAP
ncbi:Gfo/Idh/MocA family oxidoreductase [Nocardioides sp. NPDC006273]|uniref:Gfo/Idh/MocA family oxidoreductase n=1 Tax=Nocardioides sp. NPDC006273 TaxID=3155598 RepID=UPI00339F3FB5